ncbi:MAG: hypothetical protein QXQ79_01895, partial [Candidatus Nanoarchaeia archaeon]
MANIKRVTLNKIKKDLERIQTLTEKRKYLEELLSVVKSKNLLAKIKELLDKINKHIAEEVKYVEPENLEIKLAKPKFEISANEVERALEEIKYIGQKKEAKLETEIKKVQITPMPPAEEKYSKFETTYQTAKEAISSLKTYLTRI